MYLRIWKPCLFHIVKKLLPIDLVLATPPGPIGVANHKIVTERSLAAHTAGRKRRV